MTSFFTYLQVSVKTCTQEYTMCFRNSTKFKDALEYIKSSFLIEDKDIVSTKFINQTIYVYGDS